MTQDVSFSFTIWMVETDPNRILPMIDYVADLLLPMIEQAKAEGKWLWRSYQDLWVSPDRLRQENLNGRFRWGPINWQLRDPQERVEKARARAAAAMKELREIEAAVGRPMTDLPADQDRTHPHHRKLRAIELQTEETRDLMVIAVASELGILVGERRRSAERIVHFKLMELLKRWP